MTEPVSSNMADNPDLPIPPAPLHQAEEAPVMTDNQPPETTPIPPDPAPQPPDTIASDQTPQHNDAYMNEIPEGVQTQAQGSGQALRQQGDTLMTDAVPRPTTPASATPSSMPKRNATPVNNATPTNGTVQEAPTIPSKAAVYGAPARAYLNTKVTGVLLEGMKMLAKEQPEDPLRMLGEYLLKRSKEIEGAA